MSISPRTRAPNKTPIVEGERFGNLTALMSIDKGRTWLFLCDCGQQKELKPSHVRRKNGTQSCGCTRSSLNGLEKSKEWKLWNATYSDAWADFRDFWTELGPKPAEGMFVTRIDPDKPIGPRNAMWAAGQTLFGKTEMNSFEGLTEMITNNKSLAAIHKAAYEARKDPSSFEWYLNRIEAEHRPEDDLEEQQASLENKSMEYSKSQWLRSQSSLEEKGRQSTAEIGKQFMRKLVPILSLRINEDCEQAQKRLATGGARHGSMHNTLIPTLRDYVDDHTIAYITIACVMDSIGRGASAKTPAVKVYTTIGERLDHQLFMAVFKEAKPESFQRAEKRFLKDETRTYRRKVYALQRIVQDEAEYEPLSDEERLQLGAWAAAALDSVTKWFETENLRPDPRSPKTVAYMCLSVEGLKHRSLIEAAAAASQFQVWPMVSRPLDWSEEERGGFLNGHPGGSAVLIHGDRGTEPSQETYDAINRLQSVPWRVNRLIYEIQKELLSSTNHIGAFKSYEKDSWMDEFFPFIDPKVWEVPGSEEYDKAKTRMNIAYDNRALAEKQRHVPQRVLEVAARFVQFGQIYFTCFMDARGRLYYTCDTLTPQGSDYQKALLEFADGTEVTAENFDQVEREYLINLANTWDKVVSGCDRKSSKLTYEDRVEVMRKFVADLDFVVDDPMESEARKVWTSANEPFLFLATLVEYWNVCVAKTQTTAHAPLALDATNSGSQILGGILRNEKLCHFTNVIPSDDGLPQDMYGEVARFAQARWNSVWLDEEFERINNNARLKSADINAEKKAKGQVEDHVPRVDFSRKLKASDITRSVCKRPSMCSSYGASHGSKWTYVKEELEEAGFVRENRVSRVEGLACTNAIIKGQADAFPILDLINHFFVSVGRMCLGQGQEFVHWRTPTGNLIRQEYREAKTKQVRTHAMGGGTFHQFQKVHQAGEAEVHPRYELMVGYGDVIESKTASALAANWTHSIDASVACTAINSFDDSCGFIHDCLVAPPGKTFQFAEQIRQAYHRCITANVFGMLAEENGLTFEQIMDEIPEEKRITFGKVDIDECLKSPYLFM